MSCGIKIVTGLYDNQHVKTKMENSLKMWNLDAPSEIQLLLYITAANKLFSIIV